MKGQFIAAIAGSAGSHERILEFFDHTPHDDVSYVILQHLPAHWQSKLTAILARHTKLTIQVIRHGMVLHKDIIYIAPPGQYVTITKDIFAVADRTGPVQQTADIFMSSVAVNSRQRAIGIVLEGALKDGTLGCKAIHDAGGLTIAQDPATCRFCSMPENAIEARVIDRVSAIIAMPALIHAYVRHVQTRKTA